MRERIAILASGIHSDWALAEAIGLRRLTDDFPLRVVNPKEAGNARNKNLKPDAKYIAEGRCQGVLKHRVVQDKRPRIV